MIFKQKIGYFIKKGGVGTLEFKHFSIFLKFEILIMAHRCQQSTKKNKILKKGTFLHEGWG